MSTKCSWKDKPPSAVPSSAARQTTTEPRAAWMEGSSKRARKKAREGFRRYSQALAQGIAGPIAPRSEAETLVPANPFSAKAASGARQRFQEHSTDANSSPEPASAVHAHGKPHEKQRGSRRNRESRRSRRIPRTRKAQAPKASERIATSQALPLALQTLSVLRPRRKPRPNEDERPTTNDEPRLSPIHQKFTLL